MQKEKAGMHTYNNALEEAGRALKFALQPVQLTGPVSTMQLISRVASRLLSVHRAY